MKVESGVYYPILVSCVAGDLALGYVFPFECGELGSRLKASKLRTSDSSIHLIFSILSIEDGQWPVIAALDGFLEEEWPIPFFSRPDPLLHITWKLHFGRNDLMFPVKQERISPEEAYGLREHAISAAGSVEAKVERILGKKT